MLGMILAAGTGLLLFIYISILYLPIIAMKDERTGVKLARKKLRWLSRIVLKSLGVKLRVIYKNRKNINALEREKGIIFVCNHQSNLDIPVIVSVISEDTDIEGRIKAGASILNVSASTKTPMIVAKIRKDYPKFPIIATGGHTDETILETIAAGANAITWSPPTVQSLFKKVMNSYRNNSDYYQ